MIINRRTNPVPSIGIDREYEIYQFLKDNGINVQARHNAGTLFSPWPHTWRPWFSLLALRDAVCHYKFWLNKVIDDRWFVAVWIRQDFILLLVDDQEIQLFMNTVANGKLAQAIESLLGPGLWDELENLSIESAEIKSLPLALQERIIAEHIAQELVQKI